MLSGLPIIATDVGGNRDFIDDEKTGLLVPVQSPGHLASAIERLIASPSFAKCLGQEAKKEAERRFAIELVLEGHSRLYDMEEPDEPTKADG